MYCHPFKELDLYVTCVTEDQVILGIDSVPRKLGSKSTVHRYLCINVLICNRPIIIMYVEKMKWLCLNVEHTHVTRHVLLVKMICFW